MGFVISGRKGNLALYKLSISNWLSYRGWVITNETSRKLQPKDHTKDYAET